MTEPGASSGNQSSDSQIQLTPSKQDQSSTLTTIKEEIETQNLSSEQPLSHSTPKVTGAIPKNPNVEKKHPKRKEGASNTSILIQLVDKLIKKHSNPDKKLGSIGKERVYDLIKFGIYAGVLTPDETLRSRNEIRAALKAWWRNEDFDVLKQLEKTLCIAQFDVDIEEAKRLIVEQTNLRVETENLGKRPSVGQVQYNYKDIVFQPNLSEHEDTDETSDNSLSDDTDSEIEPEMAQEIKPKLSPRYFSGQNEAVKDYFLHYERVSQNLHWSEETKVSMLPIYLIGDAQKYYTMLSASMTARATFEDYKQAFIKRFQDPMLTEKLRTQLYTKRQGKDETARNFLNDVQLLAYEIDPQISEKEILRVAQLGFQPDITYKIASAKKDTLTDLRAAIDRTELSLEYAKIRETQATQEKTEEQLKTLQKQVNNLTLQKTRGAHNNQRRAAGRAYRGGFRGRNHNNSYNSHTNFKSRGYQNSYRGNNYRNGYGNRGRSFYRGNNRGSTRGYHNNHNANYNSNYNQNSNYSQNPQQQNQQTGYQNNTGNQPRNQNSSKNGSQGAGSA